MQAAAAVGIAQAVFQQIVKELHQAVAVAEDHRLLRERHLDAQLPAGEALAKGTCSHLQQGDDIQRGFLVGQRSLIGHRQMMEIVYQLGEGGHFSLCLLYTSRCV